MRSLRAALAVIAIGLPAIAAADDDEPPIMHPERPVSCAKDRDGKVWRLQCDHAAKVCLYAPDEELDAEGRRIKPLERARDCSFDPFDRARLEASGYVIRPGRADAPFGWTRDARGRVFQVSFDLKRRMYFGAAYSPQKILEDPLQSTRTSIDYGLFVFETRTLGRSPMRHRIRLLEGDVHLEPFTAELTVAHYDMSRRFFDPLVRITTFAGTPQRHDLHLNLGMWTEVGGLEIHKTDLGHSQLWKHANAQLTLDLWQSADQSSFARVRTGLALEGQYTDVTGYRSALTAGSAFELDCVLDDEGFHNLRLEVAHEMPRYFIPLERTGKLAQRMHARLLYEAIILAINDQPLTLKLAVGGEKRDDIPGIPDQWAFVMDAGLRFSLWAPPRPHS